MKRKINASSRIVKKGVRPSKLSGGLLILGILLLAILVVLILVNTGFFEQKQRQEQLFVVRDECSNVMGNVIHNMRNEGDCHIRCRNECEIRSMEFVRTQFTPSNNSCHSCNCYCK